VLACQSILTLQREFNHNPGTITPFAVFQLTPAKEEVQRDLDAHPDITS
jgi:hypothetical protein